MQGGGDGSSPYYWMSGAPSSPHNYPVYPMYPVYLGVPGFSANPAAGSSSPAEHGNTTAPAQPPPAAGYPASSSYPGGCGVPANPPADNEIHPPEIHASVGRRVIVHLHKGSLVSGVLRQVIPNGNLLLTEALQGDYKGPKLLLGKVEMVYGTFSLVCPYHSCGSRTIFPQGTRFNIRL